MEIPSFFMGKIIVTLFPFTDIPSGMKPSVAKSSVLTRHPGSALNSWKVPKMPCFCGFYGVGSNEPVDEPSGFKRRGKIKLYQCRSYYAKGIADHDRRPATSCKLKRYYTLYRVDGLNFPLKASFLKMAQVRHSVFLVWR